MISTATSTALTTLLDRAQAFAPEYGGNLSNHLPMALVALNSLGADVTRLEAFFTIGSARLDPAPPFAQAFGNWSAKRGDLTAFASLRTHFSQEIAASGRDATLRQTLPLLIDGVGAAAFHGLLRTASAVSIIRRALRKTSSRALSWSNCLETRPTAAKPARKTTISTRLNLSRSPMVFPVKRLVTILVAPPVPPVIWAPPVVRSKGGGDEQ